MNKVVCNQECTDCYKETVISCRSSPQSLCSQPIFTLVSLLHCCSSGKEDPLQGPNNCAALNSSKLIFSVLRWQTSGNRADVEDNKQGNSLFCCHYIHWNMNLFSRTALGGMYGCAATWQSRRSISYHLATYCRFTSQNGLNRGGKLSKLLICIFAKGCPCTTASWWDHVSLKDTNGALNRAVSGRWLGSIATYRTGKEG